MNFLSPWFLFGVAAVAVPILVHLVRREQAKRVPFPSLMFVWRIPQKSTRRRSLRNLLLLVMRCLALLLLVLAFARPFISSGVANNEGKGRNLILLLDTSFSMQYGDRFKQAREHAQSLIRKAHSNDRIALMTFSQGYDIVQPLSSDHQALLTDLAKLAPTLNATNYVQGLRGAAGLLQGTTTQENVVFLISDFQASGWNTSNEPISFNAKLIPIDVAGNDNPNTACVEVAVEPVVYSSKYDDRLRAKVTNFGDQLQSVHVRFTLNERVVKETTLNLDAQGSEVVESTGFTLLDGSNRGIIEVEGDAFPLDNRFFFTIEKSNQISVLGLESSPNESFYLQQALAVSPNTPYAFTIKKSDGALLTDLEQARIVIFNDVSRVDDTLVNALKAWIGRGGNLILALGHRVDVEAFNRSLEGLSPAHLEKNVTLSGGRFELMTQLAASHPIFAPFAQVHSGNFSLVRFYGYTQARPKETAHVLARLTNGEPLLLEQTSKTGKVLLFTSSLDTSWNDLPLSPTYLPLMQQFLGYLHNTETREAHHIGETVQVASSALSQPIPIDSPSEQRLRGEDGLSPDSTLFTAKENGFYRFRDPKGERHVAVNLDFRESDLRKLDVDKFVEAFSHKTGSQAIETQLDVEPVAQDQEHGRRFWWPLLIAALALFAIEALMAGRFTPQPGVSFKKSL